VTVSVPAARAATLPAAPPQEASPARPPRIGLALGGGGAKGLAHILALEAFDQANIRPAVIAGASIGAIIGGAYAAGYGAKAIRAHVLRQFRDRAEVMAKLFRARVGKLSDLFASGLGNPVLVDAEQLLHDFWPASMPERFSDLRLPFSVITTDFYGMRERVIGAGPLKLAVAASMAVPGLVRPVMLDGRLHIDGVVVNPLPFDRCAAADDEGPLDVVIAVDVVGGPDGDKPDVQPSAIETTLGASQIMQAAIVAAKLPAAGPAVRVIRPEVGHFGALEFFSAKAILAAAEPIRAEVAALIAAASAKTSLRDGL
jgi:NTE family protein